ncbi:hypothetical protein FBU30_009514 [Linnemannia zychae]|nr:hypothetical protein FBU30_009514 [Linnemannia zychae]
MASPSASLSSITPAPLRYFQRSQADNQLLPLDIIIQVFMHLCQEPQDLLNCALTTRTWTTSALQELYRHPWSYLFTYQFETEGRVMDKTGSMLLLRTLFQGCIDPSRTTLPYASFARSVNLKWVHDTFDLPEVDIQTLTGFRWTRNEAPKDFLIRHLLVNRPYLSDFVHCHAPRLPRCLFAHITTAVPENNFGEAGAGLLSQQIDANGSIVVVEPAETVITAHTASTDSDDWEAMMEDATNEDLLPPLDTSLLSTPPLLPIQQQQLQPVATAMPLVHADISHSSVANPPVNASENLQGVQNSFLQILNASGSQSQLEVPHTLFSPVTLSSGPNPFGSPLVTATIQDMEDDESNDSQSTDLVEQTGLIEEADEELIHSNQLQENSSINPGPSSDANQPMISSSAQSTGNEPQLTYGFQQPFNPNNFSDSHDRNTTSSSSSSSLKPFLAAWPLTLDQTTSLVYLDLRYALVFDSLVLSLASNCRKIEFLKIATHWQHFPHSYSITDHALACLVASQHGLKLIHVDNHREISQGHELIKTIDMIAKHHGETLEALVLKSHDFQNCRLAALGKACRKLNKFSAPGGMHLLKDEIFGLTDACKLTLQHLDFSNSDIETESLMMIMKSLSTPTAARGVLKALVLLGMEDMLNQETCTAIGEYGSGLDCFRLDILESEARDVGLMLSRPCALNLRVLTLGCHDVHGELSNNILEQISLNCRNLELLDVNHWQFSSSAIEAVIRECGMLRFLNISYTDIVESTADIICKCLGEIKETAIIESIATKGPTATSIPPAESSLMTPLLAGSSPSVPHMQTPAPVYTNGESRVDSILPFQEPISHVLTALEEIQEHIDMEEQEDDILETERVELLRKQRGTETKTKEDIDDEEGSGAFSINSDSYMDTNRDHGQQFISPLYSTNGEPKKQSQLGLIHHHTNAMDVKTIMNLDLETDLSTHLGELPGMDLDMLLDLDRYHRDSPCMDRTYDDIAQIEADEINGGFDIEGMEVDVEGDNGGITADGEDDLDLITRTREPKGKDIDRGCNVYENYNHANINTSGAALIFSTSCESTASSSASSSLTSTSSSSCLNYLNMGSSQHNHQDGNISLHAAEARVLDAFHRTPLLPALPIPSRLGDGNADVDMTQIPVSISAAAGCSSSLDATITNTVGSLQMKPNNLDMHESELPFDETHVVAIEDIAEKNTISLDSSVMRDQDTTLPVSSSPSLPELVSDKASGSTIDEPTTNVSAPSGSSTSPETVFSDNNTTPISTLTPKVATVPATVTSTTLNEASLAWTKESRLEQVNVECCSNLSLATMSKIKTLSQERQADLAKHGRKKSRIWMENEHDMMMSRLAAERGPELPAERLVARVSTITSSSSSSGGTISSTSSNIDNIATTTIVEPEYTVVAASVPQPESVSQQSGSQTQVQNTPELISGQADEPISSDEMSLAVEVVA